ncbi:hypothetical protein ABT350_15375 [Streptomyces parvus]|nr:hypothetical protein [Streptomyces parvus]
MLRRIRGDPACQQEPEGTWWRCSPPPAGPLTLRISGDLFVVAGRLITGRAWGPGADWALDQLPALLGADDEPDVSGPVTGWWPPRTASTTGIGRPGPDW